MLTNISPADLCKSVMSETLKEKVDKDVDLQQFINKLLDLFLKSQQISTTHKLIESSSAQQNLSSQTTQASPPPKVVGVIQSTFLINPNKTSQFLVALTSSFTPTFTPANEPVGYLEDDD